VVPALARCPGGADGVPPSDEGTADYHEIEMLIGDREVGTFQYKLCHICRMGFVAKISIDVDQQGRGLGTRALEEGRRQAPGYRWWTSGQDATAKTFGNAWIDALATGTSSPTKASART
jgi:hypothetical protein